MFNNQSVLRKNAAHTASPPEYRRLDLRERVFAIAKQRPKEVTAEPCKFSCRTSLSKRGRGADTELFKTLQHITPDIHEMNLLFLLRKSVHLDLKLSVCGLHPALG